MNWRDLLLIVCIGIIIYLLTGRSGEPDVVDQRVELRKDTIKMYLDSMRIRDSVEHVLRDSLAVLEAASTRKEKAHQKALQAIQADDKKRREKIQAKIDSVPAFKRYVAFRDSVDTVLVSRYDSLKEEHRIKTLVAQDLTNTIKQNEQDAKLIISQAFAIIDERERQLSQERAKVRRTRKLLIIGIPAAILTGIMIGKD